jgi:hypothetical protein
MARHPAEGTERLIAGRQRVYYDGYWIKAYPTPSDTLAEKRHLIEVLTRRLFNHVEHGLYVPGARLEEARRVFEAESDPARKRVKGGMLAAALFNRATDTLTKLVELQALGVRIPPNDPLMLRCGEQLQEALTLGKAVLHRSGAEGIDELWGEPFKAFAFPVQDFYRSRYLKVAAAMRCIDLIAAEMAPALEASPPFRNITPLVRDLATAAKAYSETMRTDADVFDVWAAFAVGCEKLLAVRPQAPSRGSIGHDVDQGMQLIRDGTNLVASIARARVPMPKSTSDLIERFQKYRKLCTRREQNGDARHATNGKTTSKSPARIKRVTERRSS